jgi:hypothetical protein
MCQPFNPRNSIRLVQIHAGDSTANLACNIIQTKLDEAPPYEAISYTWGSTEHLQTIPCGPEGGNIAVTQNCESVLRRLRDPNSPRLVWIDAICIDQGNIGERNAQMAIMSQIYQNARRVVIDIGEASPSSDRALHAIMNCSEKVLYAMELGLQIRDDVGELYQRPWFERVWVLQETFRSEEATVLCGTTLVPWASFRPFKIWVDSRPAWESEHWHVELPGIVPSVLTVGNHKSRTYTARKDLLPLLCKGRTCAATDQRDKVFALLPMLADAQVENLSADYAKGMTRVFTEIATWLLSAVGLSVLSCASVGSRMTDLPSWVPDWSVRCREEWMIGFGDIYYPLLAGGNSKAITEVLLMADDALLLKVRGIAVDTIRTSSAALNLNIRSDSEELTKFVAECRSYKTIDSRGPARLNYGRYWEPRTSETRLHPPNWAAWKYGLPFERPLEVSDNEMANKVTYFCSGRQLILTERGYFGLAPDDAKAGDSVLCFLGSRVPYILRKAEDCSKSTQDRYKLIGESYIYGLMEGEALKGIDLSSVEQKDAPTPLEDFYIC